MKRIVIPGLYGTVVLVVWTTVLNVFFGFQNRMNMNTLENEREVYAMLKEHVTEPGRYTVNPEITADHIFPGSEPVFGLLFSGVGHESAGPLMWLELLVFLLAPLLSVALLRHGSREVLVSFPRKLGFFFLIGLLLGITGPLTLFGIGGYPIGDALLMTLHDVAAWTLAGAAMAWRIRPA